MSSKVEVLAFRTVRFSGDMAVHVGLYSLEASPFLQNNIGTLFSQHCCPKVLSIAEDSVLLPACAPCVLMDTHSPLVLRSEVAHVWDNMCCGVVKCCNLQTSSIAFCTILQIKI